MPNMIVKDLRMTLVEYGTDLGKLKGSVKFAGGLGEVTIAIDPEKASKILTILAEELVATAQGVANMMVGQIVDQAAGNSTLSIEGTVK